MNTFKAGTGYKYREFVTFKQALNFIKENMYLSDNDYQKALSDYNSGSDSFDFVYGFSIKVMGIYV
jgi:hypothetical protein